MRENKKMVFPEQIFEDGLKISILRKDIKCKEKGIECFANFQRTMLNIKRILDKYNEEDLIKIDLSFFKNIERNIS